MKLISRDGSSFSLVFDFKINEFLYFKSTIYYIDVNGLPHGINVPQLNDGEFAKNLRLENEDVICTVFNSDYMPVKELKLN